MVSRRISRKAGGIIIGVILGVAIIAIIPVFVPVTIARLSTGYDVSGANMRTSAWGCDLGNITMQKETINAYQNLGYQLSGNIDGSSSVTGTAWLSVSASLVLQLTLLHPNGQTYTLDFSWHGSFDSTGIFSHDLIISSGQMPIEEGIYEIDVTGTLSVEVTSIIGSGTFDMNIDAGTFIVNLIIED